MNTIIDILQCNQAEAKQVMYYLFGQINYQECLSIFPDRPTGRKIIDAARESGYIMTNCKLYAYYYWYHGHADPDEFEISRVDTRLLQRLELEFKVAIKPFTYKRQQIIMGNLLTSTKLNVWMDRLIYRKMRFLIQSYGYTREDIKALFIEKTIYALMKQYPAYHSPLHFFNTAKTTIHNTAQTFITSNTRQKNQRLVQNEDGTFSSLVANLDAIGESDVVTDCKVDLKESLTSIVQLSEKFSPDVYAFVQIMAGIYDEGFSEYLGRNNQDAIETMKYETYRTRLERYMGVTRDQTERIFVKIMNHLQ